MLASLATTALEVRYRPCWQFQLKWDILRISLQLFGFLQLSFVISIELNRFFLKLLPPLNRI